MPVHFYERLKEKSWPVSPQKDLREIKSEGYAEPALSFDALEKLVLPLAGYSSKRASPYTHQEKKVPILTTDKNKPTRKTCM